MSKRDILPPPTGGKKSRFKRQAAGIAVVALMSVGTILWKEAIKQFAIKAAEEVVVLVKAKFKEYASQPPARPNSSTKTAAIKPPAKPVQVPKPKSAEPTDQAENRAEGRVESSTRVLSYRKRVHTCTTRSGPGPGKCGVYRYFSVSLCKCLDARDK